MYMPDVIDYDEPLFRPPSEAYSLIFQVTLGCSWNKCAFCKMYSTKEFRVRKEGEVIAEIKEAGKYYRDIRKIFLADGNAMALSTGKLMRILESIKEHFPNVSRVSSYALPRDIMAKTPEELKQLYDAGLQLLYVGIESGDDDVLRMINKCETFNSTVDGLLKAQEAGIKLSVMIVNGLAGEKYMRQHAENSALILNKIQPFYFSTLVLMLPQGVQDYKQKFEGEYIPMNEKDLLKELEILFQNTQLERTIFRSDHASNFMVLKGTLSRDKEKFIRQIQHYIDILPEN